MDEEAIKILGPATSRETLLRYEDNEERVEAVNEACLVACAALRAQQIKLDRSQWEGCEWCKGDLEGYTAQFRDAGGRSKPLYIPDGEAMIVVPGKYNHQVCIPIKYCPICGRPLTEEAWAELDRRINGGTIDNKTQ